MSIRSSFFWAVQTGRLVTKAKAELIWRWTGSQGSAAAVLLFTWFWASAQGDTETKDHPVYRWGNQDVKKAAHVANEKQKTLLTVWLIWLIQVMVSKWRNEEIDKDWLHLNAFDVYRISLTGFVFRRPMCNIPNACNERCASHIALQLYVIAHATCDHPSALAALAFHRILGDVDSTSSFLFILFEVPR